ncbi:hypothetical protein [Streptomyces melanogenes]|uniref:hypothetical protein n=1 Tax=Streptomyces melanogenes TaxID=67326 RepID=UPI0037934AC0
MALFTGIHSSRPDRHDATPPLRAFLENLSTFLEETPEGYFDTMLSPYPETQPASA